VEPVEVAESTPAPEPEPEARVFVGGRERTVGEVVSGYEASSQEAMRLRAEHAALMAERDAIRREADAYRSQLTRAPEPDVPELGEDPDPKQLAAWVETIAERRAQKIADERVRGVEERFQQFIGAAQQFNAVQAEMKQGDASFDAEKLSAYLSTNPDVQKRYNSIFAVDQAAALEYGWTKAKGQLGVAPDSSRVVQAPTKRRAPAEAPDDAAKRRQRMLDEAERTGNWEKFYAERARGTSMQVPSE